MASINDVFNELTAVNANLGLIHADGIAGLLALRCRRQYQRHFVHRHALQQGRRGAQRRGIPHLLAPVAAAWLRTLA